MDTLSYKTQSVTPDKITKEWVLIDATDMVLGRLCSTVAKILRGKYKPEYTPYLDCGDNVVIINAEKIRMTGKKFEGHQYLRYTGYPGGQRTFTPADLMAKSYKATMKNGKHPLFIKVVKGMLPKGPLGRSLMNNLYIYEGTEHKHEAQKPRTIDINQYK